MKISKDFNVNLILIKILKIVKNKENNEYYYIGIHEDSIKSEEEKIQDENNNFKDLGSIKFDLIKREEIYNLLKNDDYELFSLENHINPNDNDKEILIPIFRKIK
jgi:hypothetical protein